jgi:hypothetical protein
MKYCRLRANYGGKMSTRSETPLVTSGLLPNLDSPSQGFYFSITGNDSRMHHGTQVSLLLNNAMQLYPIKDGLGGRVLMQGRQVGAINLSENVEGKQFGGINLVIGQHQRYYGPTKLRGKQNGGINLALTAEGSQNGLVDIVTERLDGKQIGAICYAAEGNFQQYGILTIRGSGPWYSRITPFFGRRKAMPR